MVLAYILLVAGLALLWKSADWLVDGGVQIARRVGVSSFVVAVTLVSFGTTVPELTVNVQAALRGSTGLALGNVLGSFVANSLLILGVAALVAPSSSPVRVRRRTVQVEIPFGVVAALVVAFLANDSLGGLGGVSGIGRLDALVLLCLLGVFLWIVTQAAEGFGDPMGEVPDRSIPMALVSIGVGLVGLVIAGGWIVDGAVELTQAFGLSSSIVGAGVLALGTSLPELATAVVAARSGRSDLAVGNVVGANVLNLCWVLAVTALIQPIALGPTTNVDLAAVVVSSAVVLVLLRNQEALQRWHGAVMVAGYVAYLVSLGLRL